MKTINLLFLLISVLGLISCDKEDNNLEGVSVNKYIQLLKSNNYTAANLPAFTAKDIPALLEYRNEIQLITNFPHNPKPIFPAIQSHRRMYQRAN